MNVDTPYSWAWLDLRSGPVVLALPPHPADRYVSTLSARSLWTLCKVCQAIPEWRCSASYQSKNVVSLGGRGIRNPARCVDRGNQLLFGGPAILSDLVFRISRMSSAFTTLWTQDRCRELRRRDRVGQRPPVAFSGIHSSLPSWRSTDVGDDMYALHVHRGVVYVVCRMRIVDKERHGCCGAEPADYRESAFPGHGDWGMLGALGCSAAAVHVDATPVRFDRPLPGSMLSELTWRNRRGITRALKFVEDGRLLRHVSLDGVYRLTPDSAEMLRPFAD